MVLSVVISFRNEEEVIPELIRRLDTAIAKTAWNYEIIFVNDASTDASLEVLLSEHKKNQRIKIITTSRSFGVAPCLLAGMRHATGAAVVYMDADLQDPPELIQVLLQKFEQGFDVIHTTRTKRKGENLVKMLITRLAYKIIHAFSNIDIRENSGDFKLLSRRAVDWLVTLNEYDPFMRGLVRWIGFKQISVPYEREARLIGETHFSLLRSLTPAREFIRGITAFSEGPLYLSLFLGFFVSLGAFWYLSLIIIQRVFFGIHNPGWPAIMVTMLLLGGIILFTIGVLGIYVGKIHSAIKNRPSYIIESLVGLPEKDER